MAVDDGLQDDRNQQLSYRHVSLGVSVDNWNGAVREVVGGCRG